MNVSTLTPWLLDFHTVRFWQFWLFFVFKFAVVLLVVQGGKMCLPVPPSWSGALYPLLSALNMMYFPYHDIGSHTPVIASLGSVFLTRP